MGEPTAADFDTQHVAKRHPTIRPKPAASLILIKSGSNGCTYLMGRRAASLAFMPGYFVFPGGRLERQDRIIRAPQIHDEKRLGPLGVRLAACAVRELHEETGLSLPNDIRLRYVARAITPPGHIRRYDTRFFAANVADTFGDADAITPQDDELDPIGWYARQDIPRGRLHRITALVLDTLVARLVKDPTLGDDETPIPCFRFRSGKPVVDPA
ncbi:MAG: NUDIX hydrolase [Pseudomonadota bacterium]